MIAIAALKAKAIAAVAIVGINKILSRKVDYHTAMLGHKALDILSDVTKAKLAEDKKVVLPIELIMYVHTPDKELKGYHRAHEGDAGIDLFSLRSGIIWPLQTRVFMVNLAVATPKNHYMRVCGRSGKAAKGILVHPGTVDSGYRGIIGVITTNVSLIPRRFKRGERIAQGIIQPYTKPLIIEADELIPGDRGLKGFGSTS